MRKQQKHLRKRDPLALAIHHRCFMINSHVHRASPPDHPEIDLVEKLVQLAQVNPARLSVLI